MSRVLVGLSALVVSIGWVAACGDSGGGGEGGSGGDGGSGTTSSVVGSSGSGSPSASSTTSGPGSGGNGGEGGAGGEGGSEPGTGGAGGEGGAGGAGGREPGTGGAGGGEQAAKSIAMLYSQFPDPGGSGSGQSSSSGPMLDPNTLYIFLSNHDVACSDPFASACGEWEVSIGIPPNLQQPGVLQLSNPALIASMSITDPPDANGECFGGGGGSFMDGTLTIVSIDANQVVGKLENTSDIFGFSADGDFTALRCP